MIAGTTLVRRIESAESSLVADSVNASVARRAPDGAFCIPIAGGVGGYVEPGSPLNKVAGVGMEGPLDAEALAELEARYVKQACPVQVELSTHAHPSVGALLTDRGYRLIGFEDVLGRSLVDFRAAPSDASLIIERVDPQRLARWLDVIVQGFASPDVQGMPSHESFSTESLTSIMADMTGVAGMGRWLAVRNGAPAGAASMCTRDSVALLCGAATLPAHRRKGVQTALLQHRLRHAAEAGCDIAVVTTQPGSKSQENVRKQGFELLYSRAVLLRG